jgi:uncharacterized membrane protein
MTWLITSISLPGFSERLMRLTEAEADHRRQLTTLNQRQYARETTIGQVFALIVALSAFATAAWLGYLGHPGAAGVVGSGAIIGLVSAFIAGRRRTPPAKTPAKP